MAAFAPGKPARHLTSECQLCLRCLEACQKEDRVSFVWASKAPRAPLDLGQAPAHHRGGGGSRGRAPGPPGLPGPEVRRISRPAPGGPERGRVSLPLHPLRRVHEGLPDQRPAAGAVGSGPGGALYLPARPADGLLLLHLQPVRPGVPHRRHPPPRPESQTGHGPGDRLHQPLPVYPLHRRDRLPGVRGTLPRRPQGHRLLRAGGRQCPGGAGENQAAHGEPGPLHRLRPLRTRLPRGRRRGHPGEAVAAGWRCEE